MVHNLNMLRSVRLQGFKAHRDSTFPLAPITLVLGSNSAGKSSLFHALLSLKQSIDRGPNRFTDLVTDGPKVRLGRFGNVQHGHNPAGEVVVELHALKHESLRLCYRNRFPNESLPDGFLPSENVLESLTIVSGGDANPVTFADWELEGTSDDPDRSMVGYCTIEGKRGQLEVSHFGFGRKVFVQEGAGPEQDLLQKSVDRSLYGALRRIVDLRHIGPLRVPGERAYDVNVDAPNDAGSQGQHLPSLLLRRDYEGRLNDALEKLGLGIKLEIRLLPTRGNAVELRLASTSHPDAPRVGIQDVGFGVSQLLPMLLQHAIAVSDFDRAMEVALGTSEDKDTIDQHLANIPRPLLLFEQPELHLHPRLCVELVRLLADTHSRLPSDDGPPPPFRPRAQVLMETHSETIVEALQQLVRTGYLSDSDVALLSVERGEDGADGARVRRIRLRKDGSFADPWPKGFFTEHRELAFGEIPSRKS